MILSILIGIITGTISGLGIGGGSLLVLYLTAIEGISQYNAGGMNLLYFIGCAPTALIGHIRERRIDWPVALWCTLAGVTIALIAAWVATDIQHEWLRRLFGGILLFIGLKELCTKPRKHD